MKKYFKINKSDFALVCLFMSCLDLEQIYIFIYIEIYMCERLEEQKKSN